MNMRKRLILILTLSLILTVTACGTSSGGGESEVGGNEKATFQATILGHLLMIFDAKWQNFCVRKIPMPMPVQAQGS